MINIEKLIKDKVEDIRDQLPSRAEEVANELKNKELRINMGRRSGRIYKIYGKAHQASAPGESPTMITGAFRSSFQPMVVKSGDTYISKIQSDRKVGKYNLGELLEFGSSGGQLAARPYADKIVEEATKKAIKIYKRPYFGGG